MDILSRLCHRLLAGLRDSNLVGSPLKPYGTVREYGHITSNAQRSWLYRHYEVPYRKHGRLYLEPGPNDHLLGTARETAPGDDAYQVRPDSRSMTIDLFIR